MKKIYLMGDPHHGNIGDGAITFAEEQILKKCFQKYKIIKLPEKNLIEHIDNIKNEIMPEELIFLQGGGNMGDTWLTPEEGRRYAIQNFPDNKIIVFPQTVFFDDAHQLEISKKIYNGHKNLTIMAREPESYKIMQREFHNCKIFLTPDTVMTMKESTNLKRENVLVIFRNDKEKTLSNENQGIIKELLKNKFDNYITTDMHIGEDVTDLIGKKREQILKQKFEQFNRAKLVVTDRLHGMIFSAITETPCVVTGSYTHKIKSSYDKWLKKLDYIKFCDDVSKVEKEIENVMHANKNYDNSWAEDIITNVIKQCISE